MAESEARSDEQKAQDYSAMLGSVSVITNCLDDDDDFHKRQVARATHNALFLLCTGHVVTKVIVIVKTVSDYAHTT